MATPCKKTVVIDVVGLMRDLISPENAPFLHGWAQAQPFRPAFPALTCTAQATFLTGKGPKQHGITANGWYDREYHEVRNWHQSSGCVQAKRIWTALKEESKEATVFVNGWWHGMYDPSIDYFINVRPQYLQDGGKKPDIYTHPCGLRAKLQSKFGTFPLHKFWGPATGIEASKWIADSSVAVDIKYNPTLTFIYLPHMDYSLQKKGPSDRKDVAADLRQIDNVVKNLVTYYEGNGASVIILSEYGISPVTTPVYINRELRRAGFLQVRQECGGETLDCGASRAFALCDHQVAHIHIRNPEDTTGVKALLLRAEGIEKVLEPHELDEFYASEGHPPNSAHHVGRGGELIAIAQGGCWFAYYYWLRSKEAPDFASCVAIHRKPGYDPAEMLFRYPPPFGFMYLLLKVFMVYVLRIRTTVNATPLTCNSIRGSHGRSPTSDSEWPVVMFKKAGAPPVKVAEDVYNLIWYHLFGQSPTSS